MTIETSPANNLFAGFSDDERQMIAVAIRRVDELEESRRITASMSGQAQAIESDLKARGVTDGAVLREAAEAVAATQGVQATLAGEVQDYRKLFGPDGKASAAVGQYVQLLRNAHAGDVDALNQVQAARRELYEARDASAQLRETPQEYASRAAGESAQADLARSVELQHKLAGDKDANGLLAAIEQQGVAESQLRLLALQEGRTADQARHEADMAQTIGRHTALQAELTEKAPADVELARYVPRAAAEIETSGNEISEARERYEVQVRDPKTLLVATVLATSSAHDAHDAFQGKADHHVIDNDTGKLAGYQAWAQGGVASWKVTREFAAEVAQERSARSSAGVETSANEVSRVDPERVRPVEIERTEDEKQRLLNPETTLFRQDLTTALPARALPASFADRYVRDGSKIVDARDSKHVIMIDKGAKLQLPREFDGESVKAAVDVAETRGWSSMNVAGDPKFRQAVWVEAASRGIDVKGYKPTEAEQAWAGKTADKLGKTNSVAENDAVKAFREAKTPAERRAAATEHPELKKAFAIEASYSKLASKIDGQVAQDAFMKRMRDNIATDLAQGRELADIRLRRPMFKQAEYTRDQNRDQDRGR